MVTENTKINYTTSSGRSFTVREEAENVEKFEKAKQEFESAYERFKRVLAEQCTTADGEPFTLTPGAFVDYYIVHDTYEPRIESWHPWARYCRFDIGGYLEKHVVSFTTGINNDQPVREIYIDQLYAHKSNAIKRLNEIRAERIAMMEEAIANNRG